MREMAWLKLDYIISIKKRENFNEGRGWLAWCGFLGEVGRGSFARVFVGTRRLQKLSRNAKILTILK
jgi:hypothetical protein